MERIDVRDVDLREIDGIDFSDSGDENGARSLSYRVGKVCIHSHENEMCVPMNEVDDLINALETAKRVWGVKL